MLTLSSLQVITTTYNQPRALQSFFSYTLSNTPFYFRLYWNSLESEEYKNLFTKNKVLWNFGDGTYTTGPSASHFYKWPGTYNVYASVYDVNGDVHEIYADQQLVVSNPIPDIVTIGGFDPYDTKLPLNLPAGKKSYPIQIARYNSWQFDNNLSKRNYTVNLYASGCNSFGLDVASYYGSTWGHLKAYNAFIEQYVNPNNILQERIINSTITNSTSIYAEVREDWRTTNKWDLSLDYYNYNKPGTVLCGTSGTIENSRNIFFVDQKPSDNIESSVVLLYGSLDTSCLLDEDFQKYNIEYTSPYGYINIPASTQLIKSLFNPADSIEISSCGITTEGRVDKGTLEAQKIYSFDISPIKSINIDIPFIVTLKDREKYTTKSYPQLNFTASSQLTAAGDVKFSLMQITLTGEREIEDAVFLPNPSVPIFEDSGSYCPAILRRSTPIESVAISAVALIIDKPTPIFTKGYGFLMQPGQDMYRVFKANSQFGFSFVDDSGFKSKPTATYTTVGYPISGGVNITYVPGYLKSQALSADYIWFSDSNRDKIYCKVDNIDSSIEHVIDLKKLPFRFSDGRLKYIDARSGSSNKSAAPCNIVADRDGDVWVTLYDSITSFKINRSTFVATAVAIPAVDNQQLFANTDYYSNSGFAGENLILPTSLDLDSEDNVYIAYSHPLSSFIVKYDSNGNQKTVYSYGFPNTITQVLIDTENNMWVATFNNNSIDDPILSQTQNIVERQDNLFYINFKNPAKNFTRRFSFIGTLTLDIGGSVWLNQKNNTVTRVNVDGTFLDFTIGSQESSIDYVQDFGAFGGDIAGKLWIADNTEGVLYFFNAINPKQTLARDIGSVVLPDISKINEEYQSFSYYKTIGDFTGLRWFLKNKDNDLGTNFPRIITGMSSLFSIRGYDDFTIVKKNENFNLSETVKSYAIQESLVNSSNLFNNIIENVLQEKKIGLDNLGSVIYEKISNFVDNMSDIDKCNIRSLRSMYNMVGEDLDTFFEVVPPNLRKVLDILSVKRCVLFGSNNTSNSNFTLSTYINDRFTNLGNEIDIESGYFTPGKPVIIYELFSKKYTLVHNTIVPERDVQKDTSYPLSAIKPSWGWGLVMGDDISQYIQLKNFYKFFSHIDNKEVEMYDGLIDFNDPLTTISPTNSSYGEWVDAGGHIDNIITKTLYQCLY